MNKPPQVMEIFLDPGEWYFGDHNTRIRTLLGSCVSITLWHPRLLTGGMCHYLLPGRTRRGSEVLDGRYADEAMLLLIEAATETGVSLQEYEVKMFGGGNMFPSLTANRSNHIGVKNTEIGRRMLQGYGLRQRGEHVAGTGHRTVVFDIWSGHVWVRHRMIPELQARSYRIEEKVH